MPPATRKICDYPGCTRGPPDDDGNATPYITELGIATRAEVVADLMNHVKMAHELPLKLKESQADATRAEAEKLRAEAEKLRAEQPIPAVDAQEHSGGAAVTTPRPVLDKRAAIPRPEVDEGVNESDWSFFSAQWQRYKTSTQLSGTAEAQHLWAACSTVLQRSQHNAGAGSITDPGELMVKVKELAVKK